jgi:hypothetical protein
MIEREDDEDHQEKEKQQLREKKSTTMTRSKEKTSKRIRRRNKNSWRHNVTSGDANIVDDSLRMPGRKKPTIFNISHIDIKFFART